MGSTAKAVGAGPTLTHAGVVWEFSPITPLIIGQFEAWLEDKGWAMIERYAKTHSPADVDRQQQAHRVDCNTDVYAYGSKAFNDASIRISGLKQFALLSLKAANPGNAEVTPGLVETLFKDEPVAMRRCIQATGWCTFRDESDSAQDLGAGA